MREIYSIFQLYHNLNLAGHIFGSEYACLLPPLPIASNRHYSYIKPPNKGILNSFYLPWAAWSYNGSRPPFPFLPALQRLILIVQQILYLLHHLPKKMLCFVPHFMFYIVSHFINSFVHHACTQVYKYAVAYSNFDIAETCCNKQF